MRRRFLFFHNNRMTVSSSGSDSEMGLRIPSTAQDDKAMGILMVRIMLLVNLMPLWPDSTTWFHPPNFAFSTVHDNNEFKCE